MIRKEYLAEIAAHQKESISEKETGLTREQLLHLPDIQSHALIVSGVRRCGKSTLLYQLLRKKYKDAIYLNFDDPRLYDFEISDFIKLDELIKKSGSLVLMFDEIQIIKGWERYVRQKLDENFKVIVTGSNASLLSKELGTSLTGRHITKELFPFSYEEYCSFYNIPVSEETALAYMEKGGFPGYLKTNDEDILTSLLDDILVRDIAVRYNIRDVKTLQRLALYLISNVGNKVSGNKLKTIFGISSATTILEYFSFLEQSYLISFVPLFDFSIKKQNIHPKKVYAIDTGLIEVNTPNFKKDNGHKLENLVFLALRRKTKEIYYYANKGECDFLTLEKGNISEAIQVCYQLDNDNMEREISGLIEALETFGLQSGTIVSLNQKDTFEKEGKNINVIPIHQFLTKGFSDTLPVLTP